jgi:hypothetical protein
MSQRGRDTATTGQPPSSRPEWMSPCGARAFPGSHSGWPTSPADLRRPISPAARARNDPAKAGYATRNALLIASTTVDAFVIADAS